MITVLKTFSHFFSLFDQLPPENGRDQGRFGQGHKELVCCFGSRGSDTKLSLGSLAERSQRASSQTSSLPCVYRGCHGSLAPPPLPRLSLMTSQALDQWRGSGASGPALVAGAALAAGRRAGQAESRLGAPRRAAPISTRARRPPRSHDVPDAEQQLRGRPLLRVSLSAARTHGRRGDPAGCGCERWV